MAKEKASQEEIYRALRKDIENGSYPASTRLPSVRTLAKRFSASPNTISKVVSRLMESGLCTARRGVGLFVRSLPSRKITLLVGSTSPKAQDDFYGHVERRLAERCQADSIEIERYHTTDNDPPYGPDVDRIRRPGKVLLCLGLSHEPHLKQLADLRRSMIVVGHTPNRCNVSSIAPNSFRAGYLAARHLIRKGHRRIAFIGRVREVRGVTLPEAESLKELAGLQYAFMEATLPMDQTLIFADVNEAADKADTLGDRPQAVIMPDGGDSIATAKALKALGNDIERVLIGDETTLQRSKHAAAAVVTNRDELVEMVLLELKRLLDEERQPRQYLVDADIHES